MLGGSFWLVKIGWSFDEVGDILGGRLDSSRDYIFKNFVLLGAQLLKDVGEQVFNILSFRFSGNDESIILNGSVGFGLGEVQDCVIISKEVNFVNAELLSSDLLHYCLHDFVPATLILINAVQCFCSRL